MTATTNKDSAPVVAVDNALIQQGVDLKLGSKETLAKLTREVLADKINKKVIANNEAEVKANKKKEADEKAEKEAKDLEKSLKKNKKAEKVDPFDATVFLDKNNPARDPNKMSLLLKCKLRACTFYDVSLDQLTAAYKKLSGRKIDGIFINDMIDRFGFSTGEQVNRADLARKYKKNVFTLEIAIDKLKNIICYKNVLGAYGAYMSNIKTEVEKGMEEAYTFGDED